MALDRTGPIGDWDKRLRTNATPVSDRTKPDRLLGAGRAQLRRTLSLAKRQFSWREPVRPFVSSTFLDFQKEREVLVKQVFPKLEQICRSRCTYFAPVDLRWGITDEQAGSGDVIRLCLDYIVKSRPYFIGLIGERYGSHQPPAGDEPVQADGGGSPGTRSGSNSTGSHGPDSANAAATSTLPLVTSSVTSSVTSHTPAAGNRIVAHDGQHWVARNFHVAGSSGYPWLLEEEYRSHSITALEIELAVFREQFPFVRFYFRKPCVAPVATHLESEFAKRSLADLKKRIISSGVSVFYYGSMEELGNAVMRDWREIIDEVYPPLVQSLRFPCHTEEKSADAYGDLFNEWTAHEAFAQSRRLTFVVTPELREVIGKLNSHVAKAHRSNGSTSLSAWPILVLAGERGSGKSAVLANWSKSLSADDPDIHIVSHYVCSSSSSASVLGFMRHCIAELRAKFLDSAVGGDREQHDEQKDEARVHAAFGAALALGRAVVILDGMEEMSRESVSDEDLAWLPKPLPPQSRLVISTSEGHSSFKALQGRRDVRIINMPLLVTMDTKRQLVRSHLAVHCKQLSEDQLRQVVSSPLADKPFFLASLANEMRIFGEHEKVSERLSYYLSAKSVSHLWSLIIERWVNDYGQAGTQHQHASAKNLHTQLQDNTDHPSTYDVTQLTATGVGQAQQHDKPKLSGWLADGLRLLAVSRYGLTDVEVLSALKLQGYSLLSSLDWAAFRSAAGDALFEGQGGIVCFSHQQLRAAIYSRLLGVKYAELYHYANLQLHNPWWVEKTMWHRALGDYFEAADRSLRRTEELPWQRLMSSDVQGLSRAVCEPAVFLDCSDWLHDRGRLRLDLSTYWQMLGRAGVSQVSSYQVMLQREKPVLGKPVSDSHRTPVQNIYYAMLANAVGRLFASLSKFQESNTVLLKALDHANGLREHPNVDITSGDGDGADSAKDIADGQVLNGVRLLSSLELLGSVQEQLADLSLYQLNTSDAESWYRAALLTAGLSAAEVQSEDDGDLYAMDSRLVYRRGKLLDSLGYLKVKDTDAKANSPQQQFAHHLLLKAKTYMEVALSVPGQADVTYHLAVSNARRGDNHNAEQGMRDALRARKTWYGAGHPGVAEVLNALAGLLASRVNDQGAGSEAEDLFRQALAIRRQTVGPGHILTATTLFHLAKTLHRRGDLPACREAVELFQESWRIRSKSLGPDHILTEAVQKHLGLAKSDVERLSRPSVASESQLSGDIAQLRKPCEENCTSGSHRGLTGQGHRPKADNHSECRGRGRTNQHSPQQRGAKMKASCRPTSPEEAADGVACHQQVASKRKGRQGKGAGRQRGGH